MQSISVRFSLLLLSAMCTLGMFPTGAMAYPVTWEFKGTVTEATGDYIASINVDVGSPLRVVVGFDTLAPLSATIPSTSGFRYNYNGVSSLQFAIYAGDCNPCIQTSIAANNGIIVRDNHTDVAGTDIDGYGFGMQPSAANDNFGFLVIMRGPASTCTPNIVDVSSTGSPLVVEPDPCMVQMATTIFQAYTNIDDNNLLADIDFVGVPTYGATHNLTARHCAYPEVDVVNPFESFGDDCFVDGAPGRLVRAQDFGGFAGMGGFSKTFEPAFATPEDDGDATDPLGTVFGEVTFDGPVGLPVLRASSFPTAVARTNSNLMAYQEYVFGGTEPTPLQLIVDLGYEIHSNWEAGSETRPNGSTIEIGLRPGGANISATVAIVNADPDPDIGVPASAMIVLTQESGFSPPACGEEEYHQLPNGDPWPAGSILGMATYRSDANAGGLEQGVKNVQLELLACDGFGVSTVPVLMPPGGRFYLTTSIQTPARGNWAQPGQPGAIVNGFVDAANTVHVVPDPAAPPAVLQQLAEGLEPIYSFVSEHVMIDVKPNSAINTIKISDRGTISVALLGTEQFNPADVDTGTLRLGSLVLHKASKGKSSCSMTDVNVDGITDMLCGFQNEASNWQIDQTIVTLTGQLTNDEVILASDSVRLVP
jgi:hypothetical protein